MIALDPNQTFKFSLDVEASRPEAQRRVFASRFLSAGMMAEIDRLTDEGTSGDAVVERQAVLGALALAGVSLSANLDTSDFRITLDVEADAPETARTAFVCTVIPREQLEEIEGKIKQANEGRPGEVLALLQEAIGTAVILPLADGSTPQWKDASLDELREIAGKRLRLSRLTLASSLVDLATEDLWDVLSKVVRLSRLTEIDRKKSALQLASAAAARSARTVKLASA